MTFTCEHVEQRLTDYLDRLLSPAERAAFEAHVQSCVRCTPLVAGVRGIVGQLHRMAPAEPPAALVSAILEQTLGPREAKPSGWRAWLRFPLLLAQPRLAMGAVTLAITFTLVSQVLGIQWTQIELKDLHPVALYHAADRKLNLLFARGVKFVNDLRLVYEIQTRLRPEADPEPEPEPAAPPSDAPAEQPSKRNRELNRADEIRPAPSYLASALPMLPGPAPGGAGRSLR